MDILDGMSMDIEQNEREKLKAVFPQCFVEDKLDIDKLLSMCGEYITNDFEKYKFEWKGKSECLQLAQRRSTGTLRPKLSESVNFDTTGNVYIKGDNLEVLKILQTAYHRKVKMIYIDPPYNTGNDFVYEDDFTDPIAKYKEVTAQATRSNPETMGRFHTAWLNMIYPRLRLAATLLRDDGVIFISIDDNEVHNLRKICDEVFGEENFVCQFIWKSKLGKVGTTTTISSTHEYILCYGKRKDELKFKMIETSNDGRRESLRQWGQADRREDRPSMYYPITINGIEVYPIKEDGTDGRWRVGKDTAEELLQNGLLELVEKDGKYNVYRNFEAGISIIPYDTLLLEDIGTTAKGALSLKDLNMSKSFDYSKPIELIKHFIMLCMKDNDLILDFFSGSATTAHAVMQLNAEDGGNRRFIMVQLPELCDEKSEAYKAGYKTICDIGIERIRRAGDKILAEKEEKDKQLSLSDGEPMPLDTGFKVFELDTSNLKTWDTAPVKPEDAQLVLDRMNTMFDRVKPDRTDLDMIYEIMLKMGFELTYPITEIDVQGKKAYVVEDFLLLIFLAQSVTPEIVEELCEYAPGKLIIGKNSFDDATAMSNAYYICKDRDITLKLV